MGAQTHDLPSRAPLRGGQAVRVQNRPARVARCGRSRDGGRRYLVRFLDARGGERWVRRREAEA